MEPKYNHPTSGKAYHLALLKSAEGKHITSVFLLLDLATIETLGPVYQDILMIASANGCLPLVEAMVKKEADVNDRDREPRRQLPLELAARGGHEAVVSYLLANGAISVGRAALWDDAVTAAAANGHINTLKILLQSGADIDSRLGQRSTTPLHEAARYNRVEMVRFLLEKGAALNVMEVDMVIYLGHEALERAIKKGHKEIVRALAEGGVGVRSAAPDCTEKDPSPIILAKMWAQDDIIALLKEL